MPEATTGINPPISPIPQIPAPEECHCESASGAASGADRCERWTNPLAADLDHVLARTRELWEELRGARLFLTGGTGFIGCWLLESFLWANARLGLGATALVLSRDPESFRRRAPHLASGAAVHVVRGDVKSFGPLDNFTHVVHAATESSRISTDRNPLAMLDTILHGTRRVLELAWSCRAAKLLLISSGAVYGRQPESMTAIPEDYSGAPDPTLASSAYGEGKRVAELLCAEFARQHGIEAKIARCFTFVGPYLPLDTHFAVGNFVGDGLASRPVTVNGDGAALRSYLSAAEMTAWLWTILFRGRPGRPYNVGSEQAITIRDLAGLVAGSFSPPCPVRVLGKTAPEARVDRYVPSTERARLELGLRQETGLAEALAGTIQWHQAQMQQLAGSAGPNLG